ncbi:MAG TPA: phytase [Rhodospirillales bacterium]|nr:phytase [Rhodospirillales bacterium]
MPVVAGRSGMSAARTLAIVASLALSACASGPAPIAALTVQATGETDPVPGRGDAADDPAIWVNRSNPAESLIIGTDKKRGLNVYGLDGGLRQALPVGRVNNVDLRDGFDLAGRRVTIVAASDRDRNSIALFALSPDRLDLTDVADGVLATGLTEIYGLCMYEDRKQGRFFVFVNDKDGRFQQHELVAKPDSARVVTRIVREFRLDTQPEGCVADDELGWLYVGEEGFGFYRMAAAPDAAADLTAVDTVGTGALVADVEGLAIYRGADGGGYLVVSSQGDNAYALYRRAPPNAYVGRFRIADGEVVDGASETDGLEVTSLALPAPYDEGLLVVQDGHNTRPREPQNFKLVPWSEVRRTMQLEP